MICTSCKERPATKAPRGRYCDQCRAANPNYRSQEHRERSAAYKARLAEDNPVELPWDYEHGDYQAVRKFKCKCQKCRRYVSEKNRARYAARNSK